MGTHHGCVSSPAGANSFTGFNSRAPVQLPLPRTPESAKLRDSPPPIRVASVVQRARDRTLSVRAILFQTTLHRTLCSFYRNGFLGLNGSARRLASAASA